MNVSHYPTDYRQGQKVRITEASWQHIRNYYYSSVGPCNTEHAEKLKAYIGKVGKVGIRFRPGYEFNVEFPNGSIFQLKDNFVEPVTGIRFAQHHKLTGNVMIAVFDETHSEFNTATAYTRTEKVLPNLEFLIEKWNAQQPENWFYEVVK